MRSKILPQRPYESQVFGSQFESLFGPTRPIGDTGCLRREATLVLAGGDLCPRSMKRRLDRQRQRKREDRSHAELAADSDVTALRSCDLPN